MDVQQIGVPVSKNVFFPMTQVWPQYSSSVQPCIPSAFDVAPGKHCHRLVEEAITAWSDTCH
eukprot:2451915-Prorocentrum_lima.AAC.1